jgi:putative MATE family efflux protein
MPADHPDSLPENTVRSRRIVEGPLALELARFGAPLALGTALQVTFNLVDAWILGKMPPADVGPAMGALGICDQIAAIGTILSYGVSTATAARLAILKGAGDAEGVKRTAWQSLLIVLAMAAVFGVLGIGFGGAVIRYVVGAKGDVAEVGSEYLRVILGGGFSIFLLFQLSSIQRALGSSKTPVALLVGGNVINVALAIVMVFGPEAPPIFAPFGAVAHALGIPRMGMVGAAWATVIARSIVLVPNIVIVARRFAIVPRRGERGPDRKEIRAILRIGWPASAQLVLRVSGMLLVTSVVARAFTTQTDQTASTAIGLVFRLDTMALFVAMGWGSAAQTFVGQALGAGRRDRARASGLVTAAYDVVTNIVLWWAVVSFGEDILRIFDADPAPLAIAMKYLHIVAPSYLGLGWGAVLANAITGAGATRTTFVVDAAILLGFQLPACIIAANFFPIEGLFWCVVATSMTGAIVYSWVYLRGSWMDAVAKLDSPVK